MAFKVRMWMKPEGHALYRVKTEMSTDQLGLALRKTPENVYSINKAILSMAQKKAIAYLAHRVDINSIQPDGKDVNVGVRMSRFFRVIKIKPNGETAYADGYGPSVEISRQDPLIAKVW